MWTNFFEPLQKQMARIWKKKALPPPSNLLLNIIFQGSSSVVVPQCYIVLLCIQSWAI